MRRRLSITQAEVAQRMGVTQGRFSAIEHAKPGATELRTPDPGKSHRFPCSSPPSDTQSGAVSPVFKYRLNTRTARLMPAASPRR